MYFYNRHCTANCSLRFPSFFKMIFDFHTKGARDGEGDGRWKKGQTEIAERSWMQIYKGMRSRWKPVISSPIFWRNETPCVNRQCRLISVWEYFYLFLFFGGLLCFGHSFAFVAHFVINLAGQGGKEISFRWEMICSKGKRKLTPGSETNTQI